MPHVCRGNGKYATKRSQMQGVLIQIHPRRRKMSHGNPGGDKNEEVRGVKMYIFVDSIKLIKQSNKC